MKLDVPPTVVQQARVTSHSFETGWPEVTVSLAGRSVLEHPGAERAKWNNMYLLIPFSVKAHMVCL